MSKYTTTSKTATPRLFTMLLALLTMTSVSQAADLQERIWLTSLKDNAVPGYEADSGKTAMDGFQQAVKFHSTMGRFGFHYTFATLDPEAIKRFAPGKDPVDAIRANQDASGSYMNEPEEIKNLQYRFHQIPMEKLDGPVLKATWENVLELMQAHKQVFDGSQYGWSECVKKFLADKLAPEPSNDDLVRLAAKLPQDRRAAFDAKKCGSTERTSEDKAWRNWVAVNLEAASFLTDQEKMKLTDTWYDIENAANEFAKKDGWADKGAPIQIYSSRWQNPDEALKEIKGDVRRNRVLVSAWKIRAYLYKQSFYSNFAGYGYGLGFAKKTDTASAHLTKGGTEYVFANQDYPPDTMVTLIDGDCLDQEATIPEPKRYDVVNNLATALNKKSSELDEDIKKLEAELQQTSIAKQIEQKREEKIRLRIQRVKDNLKERLDLALSDCSSNASPRSSNASNPQSPTPSPDSP